MLLLRGTTILGDIIEFYFDDIVEVSQDEGAAIISWGDDTAMVLNNTVEVVADDTDPMIQ